jgi:hypothetical protein
MRLAGGRRDGPSTPIEPGAGAVPGDGSSPGLRHFGAARPGGVVFQGGSPEVPPSPGAARLRAANAQDTQPPQGQPHRPVPGARETCTCPGGGHLCRTRRYMQSASSPATARGRCTPDALSTHFPRTCQQPAPRSMTALHPPDATDRAVGGRNSLASASRCRWVSGPRPATTPATHARSSSES